MLGHKMKTEQLMAL